MTYATLAGAARRAGLVGLFAVIPIAASATAQTQPSSPQAARQTTDAAAAAATDTTGPNDHAVPLAAGRRGEQRVVSKNEAYNLGRAAEGRVGVRLGDDMSFRVGGN